MSVGRKLQRILGFLILTQLLSVPLAGAGEDLYTVTIIPIRGEPFRVEDFNQKGVRHYSAFLKNRKVKFDFKDLHSIEFTEPGSKGYPAIITFRNGTMGEYKLFPYGNMEGKAGSGRWQMSHRRIKAIKFIDDGKGMDLAAPVNADQDRIVLIDGDNLSGRIVTGEITLTTFYGVLNFPIEKIQKMSFHGGGENPDVVILRTGDRLSGHVEQRSVKITTETEDERVLTKDKIRTVLFKE